MKFEKLICLLLFSATASYPYVEAFFSQNQEYWIQAHVNAFEYFNGIPRLLVPDNLKTGIEKPSNYDPVENRVYYDMAEYYGVAIVPARISRPRDKAKVESAVGDIETWILAALRNQKFFSITDLNAAIQKKVADFIEKPFQKREGSRRSIYLADDLPALKPLPAAPYEIAEWIDATVQLNYHIAIHKMYYNVPYSYIHYKVNVRVSKTMIEVFYNRTRLCSHPRLYGRLYQYSTNPDHMPRHHRQYLEWNAERFISWAKKIGPDTQAIVERILTSRKVEEQAYKGCLGLLKLADCYSAERLEHACGKALSLNSPSCTTVRNILKGGMDKLPDNQSKGSIIPLHSNIRGADYYTKGVHDNA